MASSSLIQNGLTIRYRMGVTSAGADVYGTQTFKNVGTSLTDAKLIEFLDLVDDLMDYSVSTMLKENTFMLSRI